MKKICLFFSLLSCFLIAQYGYAASTNTTTPSQISPQQHMFSQPMDPNRVNDGQMMNYGSDPRSGHFAGRGFQGGSYEGAYDGSFDNGSYGYNGGDASCCGEQPCGDCYCLYCRYKPCTYYTTRCEYCPQYSYRQCCRYVPQYYQQQCCRYVPQYYCKTCCRYCPQYYYVCDCKYCPKYTQVPCCYYQPEYYYKHVNCQTGGCPAGQCPSN